MFSKTQMKKLIGKPDFYASLVLLILGLVVFFIIIPQQIIVEDEAVIGPDLLPNICILLIISLSFLLLIKTIKSLDNSSQEVKTNLTSLEYREKFTLLESKRVFLLSLNIFISILIFTYIDVLASVTVLTIGSCLICGIKKLWIIIILPACLLLLAYFLLYQVLGTAIG